MDQMDQTDHKPRQTGFWAFLGFLGSPGLLLLFLSHVCVCVVLKILVKIQTSARQLPSLSFACLYVCVCVAKLVRC